jgi:transcription initiation factor IIE alpha subunit
MKITEAKKVSVSAWEQTCPYCGKSLKAVHISQLNQQYKMHIDYCKANPDNKNPEKENAS